MDSSPYGNFRILEGWRLMLLKKGTSLTALTAEKLRNEKIGQGRLCTQQPALKKDNHLNLIHNLLNLKSLQFKFLFLALNQTSLKLPEPSFGRRLARGSFLMGHFRKQAVPVGVFGRLKCLEPWGWGPGRRGKKQAPVLADRPAFLQRSKETEEMKWRTLLSARCHRSSSSRAWTASGEMKTGQPS
jgi:hypothetical protein